MYSFQHGAVKITVRRYTQKKTGVRFMVGGVYYNGVRIYQMSTILHVPNSTYVPRFIINSFELASEMCNDILNLKYSTATCRKAVLDAFVMMTIDHERMFTDNEAYLRQRDYISQLSRQVYFDLAA